jgi:hypothetical protein
MENQVIVDGSAVALETLRKGVAEAVKRAYGAERAYAKALNALFTFDWFTVEANDKSDEAKPVHAEKAALYKELKAADHTNPSTVWARIRKYGKEERHGHEKGLLGEDGDGEDGDGEGSDKASHERSPRVRYMDELIDLYKFGVRKDADLDEPCREVHRYIIAALAALNVDVAKIAK